MIVRLAAIGGIGVMLLASAGNDFGGGDRDASALLGPPSTMHVPGVRHAAVERSGGSVARDPSSIRPDEQAQFLTFRFSGSDLVFSSGDGITVEVP